MGGVFFGGSFFLFIFFVFRGGDIGGGDHFIYLHLLVFFVYLQLFVYQKDRSGEVGGENENEILECCK